MKSHQCPFKTCRCERCEKVKTIRENKKNITLNIRKRIASNVIKDEGLASRIVKDMPTVYRLKFPESAKMEKIFPSSKLLLDNLFQSSG